MQSEDEIRLEIERLYKKRGELCASPLYGLSATQAMSVGAVENEINALCRVLGEDEPYW